MPLPTTLKERLGFSQDPLFLVDGTSFLYRAFYAYPDLKRSDGFPTNALFILMRILSKVLREENPEHIGFFLDGRMPTFRHQRMETYKAQRPRMPEPLSAQIAPLIEGVGLMASRRRWPKVSRPTTASQALHRCSRAQGRWSSLVRTRTSSSAWT
jgi:5'-3' exonuclease